MTLPKDPAVIYPVQLKTDRDKLFACYPLIEQMCLGYNRVAEEFRSRLVLKSIPKDEIILANPTDSWIPVGYRLSASPENDSLRAKFRTYTKESKARLKKLLAERNRLIESIRWANYTPEQWKAVGKLSEEEQDAVYKSLFGDKEVEKVKSTKATSPILDELKTIRLDDLPECLGSDPTEDLTTYTLFGNHISRTADRVTWAGLLRNEDAYLYDDKDANHFDGDFEHLFKAYWEDPNDYPDSEWAWVVTWALANLVDDWVGIVGANGDGLCISSYLKPNEGVKSTYLRELDGGSEYSDTSALIVFDTIYYIEVERDESVGTYGTLYAYICTGNYYDDGGSLVDSMSVALHTSKKDFRYIYAVQSYNSGPAYTYYSNGWLEFLNLQEPVAYEKTLTESLGLVDTYSRTWAAHRVYPEILGLSDTVVKAPALIRTESLGLVDTVSKLASVVKSEALGLTDTYSRVWAAYRTYSELLGLADSVSKGISLHPLTETLGLLDTVVKSPSITRDELLGLKDIIIKDTSVTRTELLGLVDTITKGVSLPLSEILGLLDTFSRTWSIQRTYTESLGLEDRVSKHISLHALTEVLGLLDSISYGKNLTVLAKLIRKLIQLESIGEGGER